MRSGLRAPQRRRPREKAEVPEEEIGSEMTSALEADLGKFKLRSPTESDRLILRDWLRIDPSDAARFDPDFFLGVGPSALSNPACVVVESSRGPVLFLRASRAGRIYLQAAPTTSAEERARNRQALQAAPAAFEVALVHAGTEQLIWVSANAAIQSFAVKELGFSVSANSLIKFLEPAKERWTLLLTLRQVLQNQ